MLQPSLVARQYRLLYSFWLNGRGGSLLKRHRALTSPSRCLSPYLSLLGSASAVRLARLRYGRARFSDRLAVLALRSGHVISPLCSLCHLSNQTIEHVLLLCPFFNNARVLLLQQLGLAGPLSLSFLIGSCPPISQGNKDALHSRLLSVDFLFQTISIHISF